MRAGSPSRPRLRVALALAAGLAVLGLGGVVACGSGIDRGEGGSGVTATTEPTPAPTASTSTTASVTTTTASPNGGPTEATRPGDSGPQVEALQTRLYSLGYFLPAFTGIYDGATSHAVMAFQKQHGLERDGVAGPDTVATLATATKVEPTRGTERHLEVNLAHQVLVVVDGTGGAVAIDATTGKASTPTPPGTFAVFRQVNGWDPGPNGSLYRPKYFNRGIAVHGGPPVIADPASHGCVRVPDPAIDWIWSSDLAPLGTTVVVY
jgi:peptidoglycan hydrolase-like protein with peptidoglycan-binding domain